MIMDDLDFFRRFLEESILKNYMNLSLKEEEGVMDASLYSTLYSVEQFIYEYLRLNRLDLKIAYHNYVCYFYNVILNWERDRWLEEKMRWYKDRTWKERELLIILRNVYYCQKEDFDVVSNHNISRMFLLSCSFVKLRERKIRIWNDNVIEHSSMNGISACYLNQYNVVEEDEDFNRVVEYTKKLIK